MSGLRARGAWMAALGVSVLAAAGCQKALFREDEPRSQFDRYDAVRDRRAPEYVFDEFGKRRPNIAGRLQRPE